MLITEKEENANVVNLENHVQVSFPGLCGAHSGKCQPRQKRRSGREE